MRGPEPAAWRGRSDCRWRRYRPSSTPSQTRRRGRRHGEGGLTAAGVGTVLPVRLLKRGGEAICVSGGSGGTGGISQDEGCVSHDGQVAIVKRAGGKTQGSKLPVSGSPRPDVVPIAEAISQQPILEFGTT